MNVHVRFFPAFWPNVPQEGLTVHLAEGATLEIERVPMRCYCSTCCKEFEPADFVCECSNCGRPSTDIRSGRELQLTSLEVS